MECVGFWRFGRIQQCRRRKTTAASSTMKRFGSIDQPLDASIDVAVLVGMQVGSGSKVNLADTSGAEFTMLANALRGCGRAFASTIAQPFGAGNLEFSDEHQMDFIPNDAAATTASGGWYTPRRPTVATVTTASVRRGDGRLAEQNAGPFLCRFQSTRALPIQMNRQHT